jgi:hypothetical protein
MVQIPAKSLEITEIYRISMTVMFIFINIIRVTYMTIKIIFNSPNPQI